MWQEGVHGPTPSEPASRQAPESPEQPAPSSGPSATPFKFLDYFEESEHDSFAGREDEVQEVLVGLTRGRTYVVYGRPGLGKTSLLLAGVFPWLRQRGFHPVRLRLLESPVADFCAALAAELERPELVRAMEDAERLELLPRVLAEHSVREPLVLVLDQFEEFFVRFKERSEERAGFITLLGRIWHERVANVRLVLSLREDYYAQLADLRSALPDLTDNRLRLMPLTAYGARQAIVRPLQQAHISYEEAFVSGMVDQLAPWLFEPPALQIVCTELYRDAVARRGYPVHLTREDLDRLGGVGGLFRGYVNRVTRGLAAERLLLVRVVLDALIAPEARTRRAMRAEELLAVPVRAELGELREVLEHLTSLRLVRVEDRQGERWYELLHEPLVAIIEAWLLTDVDYVRFRRARKFVEDSLTQSAQWREDAGWLLSAEQLAEGVEPWKERLRVDAEQAEFLLRSSIHARARSIGYWAERLDELGAGRSTVLLLELSGHSRRETRLAAVVACGHVRDATGRLASKCLSLALSEREGAMCRAAGSSFARLAEPRDIEGLRQELEHRGPSEPLLEVLADLCEAGHQLVGFPRRWRRRARDMVDERAVERHQRSIRLMVNAGVRAALMATVVWCLTFGVGNLAYRFVTNIPEWVSQASRGTLLLVPAAMMMLLTLFLCLPVGGLVAWRVTWRACSEMVLHGRQEWTRAVLRSPALMLCCLLMAAVVGYGFLSVILLLGNEASVAGLDGAARREIILGAAFLIWLMTVGLVWLGRRCIPPGTQTLKVYLWALLTSSFPPTAVEQAVGGVILRGWTGHYAVRLLWLMGVTSTISSLLAMVLLCALYKSLEQRRALAQTPQRRSVVLARALVMLTIGVAIVSFYKVVGTDSIPFRGGRPLRGEVSLRGNVWNLADADYTTIQAPHEGIFALSMRGESSPDLRLLIDGNELKDGSLLISTLPNLTTAVIPTWEHPGAATARLDYHYLLREEPIRQELPAALSADHWTLVTLRLITIRTSEGRPTLWQVWLQGQQPPEQRQDITGVQIRPVMLQIADLPAQRCVAILGSSALLGESAFPSDIRTFITPNRPDMGIVPPADSRAERLLENFRLGLQEDGRWSLVMTFIPFQEFTPPQCQEPRGTLSLPGQRRPVSGGTGKESTLTVAIKLY